MKRLLMIICLFVICTDYLVAKPKITLSGSVEIARPKHNCLRGIWFCNPTLDIDFTLGTRTVKADFTDNQDGTITIVLRTKAPENIQEFYAESDESVSMPASFCTKFGYSSMVLIPGQYSYNPPSGDNFGSVTVKYTAR